MLIRSNFKMVCPPEGTLVVEDKNRSSVSLQCMCVVKGDWNGMVSRNNLKKSWPSVGAWTGTLKNPTKCLWRWESDCGSNFFSPPARLYAVTYITEISLHVTLSNKSHSLTLRWCIHISRGLFLSYLTLSRLQQASANRVAALTSRDCILESKVYPTSKIGNGNQLKMPIIG